MAGRRSKYTPAVVNRITQAIALGATYELACQYAGICWETFRQWRETKPAFLAALNDAEGRAAVGWLAKIEKAANEGTWQAAAWKLERRYPREYGRTVQEHSGPDGGPIPIHTITVELPSGVLEPSVVVELPASSPNGHGPNGYDQ